jgi:hypothetical protein
MLCTALKCSKHKTVEAEAAEAAAAAAAAASSRSSTV